MSKPLEQTKHFNLTRELREEVLRLGSGQALATVGELKARFGVSQATISRAMERLRKEGLIYRPAGRKRLYTSEAAVRGVRRVLVVRSTFPSPDYDAIVRELIAAGRVLDWTFEVYAFQGRSELLDLGRLGSDYDGIVLACSPEMFTDRFVAALRRPKCPLVLIRELPPDPDVAGVSLDNVEVGYRATQHLARLGHRNTLCVVCEPPSRTIRDRVQGWSQAMTELGCPNPQRLLVNCPMDPGQDSMVQTWQHFAQWMRSPLRPEFSAVFTVDWTGAVAVMRVLREEHQLSVPEDVSLISYAGEFPLAPFLQPPLTTVGGNMQQLAEQALHMLERQQTDGERFEHQVWFKPVVVERSSTRRAGPSVWPEASVPPQA